jgi:hypothetical protein
VSGGFHLAQLNVGRLLAPIDDPRIKDFADNLDRINALAEGEPGFVWRLKGEGNNASDLNPFPDASLAVNMSVWTGLDPLAAFVYRTAHRDIMRRRKEWFEKMQTYLVLWWVPAGHVPSADEAWARLGHLDTHGPSERAFTFRHPFPAPDSIEPETPVLDRCA